MRKIFLGKTAKKHLHKIGEYRKSRVTSAPIAQLVEQLICNQ